MNAQELIDTARAMAADDKGLVAMDESIVTCNKRFEKLGIAQTEEARRSYREMILITPGLGEFISGVILYDATIRQARKDGTRFGRVITDAGIIPGIKVDTGAKDMAGHAREKISDGFGDLARRGGMCVAGTASSVSSSQVQPGSAMWRIQCPMEKT